MLRRRIIAKLLVENGVLVKYRQFTEGRRIVGDPVSTARILEDQRVDEFYICDIGIIYPALVRAMTDALLTPVTVAGSIRTVDQAMHLIQECGADKVVVRDIQVAEQLARRLGAQSVVWSLDYCGDAPYFDVPDCVGEVILTSVDRDGTGTGLDTAALRFPYRVPVVIAGGCGRLNHVKQAFDAGADGVAVASMFAFSDKSPVKLRSWLASEGCNVRAG